MGLQLMGFDELRLPPQNLDAERGVLGSVLLMPEALDDLAGLLESDHFYDMDNQRIYAAIRGMYDRGIKGIDAVNLSEELQRLGQFEDVGGADYVWQILEEVPHAQHCRYYAGIVRDKWSQRQLNYALTESLSRSFENCDTDELFETTQRLVGQAVEQRHTGARHQSLADIVQSSLRRLDERMKIAAEGGITGVPTGFIDLDKHTTGLQPSELIILAARPGMGKTAFVCNVTERMARAGERVLFFSLEQANIELMDRLLSSVARVDGVMIRAGNISREEAAKLFAAAGEIETWPIYLEDKPAITMNEITAIARRLHRQDPLSVIMIDYIQLIEAADKRMPREQQVATISRNLKFLAKELGIPVIVLAQLNRDVEKRTTKRPMLADLRESGSIEQDADMVLFLNRPDAYDAQDQPGVAEVIIAKNRAGPCGIVTLTWRKELMRFEDCSFYGGGL